MSEFVTVKEKATAEIVEKKSKFIANVFPIETQEDVENYINSIKKQHFSARHNCYAYRIMVDDRIVERASDDGEPSGTAGAPMLNILNKNNLCNVLVIVTRYFGGILLGTGGLVRCYSDATIKAIEEAERVKCCKGFEIFVSTKYCNLETFKYYCKKNNINIVNTEYNENINIKIELNEESKNKLLQDFENKKVNLESLKILSEKYISKSE
ncbi:MAG: YigZ family protein [Clostridia bacterium]|nr:YigZ family protein [Clostridia bacterium]